MRDAPPPHRLLLILSGPSGAGKTTLVQRLVAEVGGAFRRVVTATTRPPRSQEEVEGVAYHFLARRDFERLLETGAFIEHAEVYGQLYGTPRRSVEEVLAAGQNGVLVVDVQGVRSLRRALADAAFETRYVFVRAPSPDELARRLVARGEDDEAAIRARLAEAAREEAEAREYDFVVVNDDVEAALGRLRERVQGWTEAAAGAEWGVPPMPRGREPGTAKGTKEPT